MNWKTGKTSSREQAKPSRVPAAKNGADGGLRRLLRFSSKSNHGVKALML
jgi:hypothetical protein